MKDCKMWLYPRCMLKGDSHYPLGVSSVGESHRSVRFSNVYL